LAKDVNKNRKQAKKLPLASAGRIGQRNRTRKAIVDATMQLMAAGASPTMAAVAKAAQVSRRTIYMYFPTLDQLLIDATLGALTQEAIDPIFTELSSSDAAARMEQLGRTLTRHASQTMHLGRALLRLTVDGQHPAADVPRRGYRRVQWIERAVAPAREQLTSAEFEQMVSALCVLTGWESLIVLQDVRCLAQREAEEVLAFGVRAVVEEALRESRRRARLSRSS
jgi:AcrR family transcriptional regulator